MKLTARGPGRLLLVLAALVAVAAPVAACGATGPTGAAVSPSSAPTPAPDLQKFYAQQLSWGSCADFALNPELKDIYSLPKLQCTYLEVPIDYSKPDAKTAQIAVLRLKAAKPQQRIGSMLVNPGGPGASGTEAALSVASNAIGTPLGDRFDIVGFDPRGVGKSKPAIQCFTPQERDADRLDVEVDNSPAGVARQEGKNKAYADKCAQHSGLDLLANAGTRDVVKDMDILRAALGDPKLTYLGYSYGTRIGYTYAEAFPQNVRALVLDGALDPDQSLIDRTVAQAGGFQKAFDAFGDKCASQPACPLGPDAKVDTDNFKKIVLPLIEKPLPLPDGRKLSYNDAMTGTIQALYSTSMWGDLTKALQDLKAGKPAGMMALADSYEERQPDGTYQFTLDAFASIGCVDDKPVTDPAEVLEANKRALAIAPFEDDGRGPSPAKDPCAFWPVPNTSEPHQPHVPGLPQIMVVSVTGDPATPYQAGVNLAKSLNARLLSVDGTQHTIALQGTKCVDDIVTKYFTDLVLPPDGAKCKAGGA
ncbi:alpha/beta hydrolase [Pseudonocardia spinosispora]|uniref:alpha/beta hydrolase n=1 Tax=Pseudonocardia spinosispora TaxID=103441 RepID=UPI000A0196B0|nr:alpha/beta hydrolase [Pseudonocardia spinosispora]